MPTEREPQPTQQPRPDADTARRPSPRRQNAARLDEVFGQVLPETTSDERDHPSGRDADGRGDDWYLENRPPHH